MHTAQNAWLAVIDSLAAPDRKAHELIRMVCTVILGSGAGVEHHAMLAAEFGATWEEAVGSILLTEDSFGGSGSRARDRVSESCDVGVRSRGRAGGCPPSRYWPSSAGVYGYQGITGHSATRLTNVPAESCHWWSS